MVFRRPHSQRPTRISGRASSTVVRDAAAPTFKVKVLNLAIGCALAGLVSVAVLAPSPALAAEPASSTASQEYAIPAGRLSDVLAQFAATSGVALSFDPQMLAGLRSNGLQGRYSVREGFDHLLASSGYQLVSAGSGGYSLHQVMTESGAMTLAPVTVTGSAISSSREELPPAYAGGQVARGGRLGILGNRDMMDTPFSQTSYTSKLIKDQQVNNIVDALGNDPSVQSLPASAGHTQFAIRGFGVGADTFLFDGLPGLSQVSNLGVYSSAAVERVEILRGPSALLNGAAAATGTVGGSVNLVPKRADDIPLTQLTTNYVSNSQVGGHADIGRRFGEDNKFGLRLNGLAESGDTPIDNHSREVKFLSLAGDYRSERFRSSIDLGYQDLDLQAGRRQMSVGSSVTALPSAPDNATNPNAPYEFSNSEFYFGTLQGELDISDDLTAFAKVGTGEAERKSFFVNRIFADNQGTLTVNGTPGVWGHKYSTYTLQSGLRGNFETGPVSHQATIGYSWQQTKDRRAFGDTSSTQPTQNLYNPVYSSPPNSDSLGSYVLSDDTQLYGIVLADTLSILEERIQLTLGVRRQQIDTTSYDRRTGIQTSAYKEYAYTPLVGVVVKPRQNVSLYGNYIEALERGGTAPDGTVNAGEVFSPYASKGIEVGAKVDWGKITTTLAAFQISRPSSYTNPDTNVFVQDGEVRNRGLEFGFFGAPFQSLRLHGGLAYVDAVLVNTSTASNNGNKAAIAPFQARLGIDWDVPYVNGLALNGQVRYASSQYINLQNTLKVSDWYQFDLGVRYTIERGEAAPIVVRATVTNVLDSDNWIGQGSNVYFPEPRTFKLSATFNF